MVVALNAQTVQYGDALTAKVLLHHTHAGLLAIFPGVSGLEGFSLDVTFHPLDLHTSWFTSDAFVFFFYFSLCLLFLFKKLRQQ